MRSLRRHWVGHALVAIAAAGLVALPLGSAPSVRVTLAGARSGPVDADLSAFLAGARDVSDSRTVDAPVLARGTLRAADGTTRTGIVTAVARGTGAQISADEALGITVLLAWTETDDHGRFELRAEPSHDVVGPYLDGEGLLTIALSAMSDDGVAMHTETVFADAPRAGHAGRWIPDPAGWDVARAERAEAVDVVRSEAERVAAIDSAAAVRDLSSAERARLAAPALADLVARSFGSPADLVGAAEEDAMEIELATHHTPPGLPGYYFCVDVKFDADLGKKNTEVGEMHVNQNWTAKFVYSNTNSSKFTTGFSPYGTPGSFFAGGTTTFSTGLTYISPIPKANNGDVMRNYDARLRYHRFRWTCHNNATNKYEYWYTFEPVSWHGMNTRNGTQANTPQPCDFDHDFAVDGLDKLKRASGAKTTWSAGLDVLGLKASTSTTVGSNVVERWTNHSEHTRYLCGTTNNIHKHTHVLSLK